MMSSDGVTKSDKLPKFPRTEDSDIIQTQELKFQHKKIGPGRSPPSNNSNSGVPPDMPQVFLKLIPLNSQGCGYCR